MIRAVLTDIEGTTSSISFVHDVLFPYAREHMADFINKHKKDAEVKKLMQDVCDEVDEKLDTQGVIDQLINWIDQDRKITPLKTLQGMIWEHGYKTGDFHGHIYEDAYNQLKAWHEQGLKLYVYSSGSVKAQQLLFSHTEYGDITPLFSGYFDTRVGGKLDAVSYRKIAQQLEMEPDEILFLSDVEKELDAARAARMHTCLLDREEEADDETDYYYVSDFNAIDPESFA